MIICKVASFFGLFGLSLWANDACGGLIDKIRAQTDTVQGYSTGSGQDILHDTGPLLTL